MATCELCCDENTARLTAEVRTNIDVDNLIRFIQQHKHISHVALSVLRGVYAYTIADAHLLMPIIAALPNLIHLTILHDNTTEANTTVRALAAVMSNCPRLAALHLSSMRLTPETLQELFQHSEHIQHLRLKNIGFNLACANVFAQSSLPVLQNFTLIDVGVTYEVQRIVAAALPPSVIGLNVAYTNLGIKGLQLLQGKIDNIQTLVLNATNLCTRASLQLTNVASRLTALSISENPVTARLLLDLQSPTLRSLFLDNTRIAPFTQRHMETLRVNCPALTKLSLTHNKFSMREVSALAGILPGLAHLIVANTRLNPQMLVLLASMVGRSQLCTLDISRNYGIALVSQAFARALKLAKTMVDINYVHTIGVSNGEEFIIDAIPYTNLLGISTTQTARTKQAFYRRRCLHNTWLAVLYGRRRTCRLPTEIWDIIYRDFVFT